jgi:hypothetical protein
MRYGEIERIRRAGRSERIGLFKWTLCSERRWPLERVLPSGAASDYLVTLEDENGQLTVDIDWYDAERKQWARYFARRRVVAWAELPAPYGVC